MLRSTCQHLMKLNISSGLFGSTPLSNTLAAVAQSIDYHAIGQTSRSYSTEGDEAREITNPKVLELAGQIMQLNLLEVSDLTELLRKRLNITAQPFAMPMGTVAAAAAGSAPQNAAAPAVAPEEEKTEFSLKLEGFDAASKIKVIKEVRAITDLGLKEAKDLVESVPAVLKEGLSKQDAEQLKTKLEAAGAKIQLG